MLKMLQKLLRWRRQQEQILICGPSGAGKTSLLASLQLAAEQGVVNGWPGGIRIFPATNRRRNQTIRAEEVDDTTAGANIQARWREMRSTVRLGQLPVNATHSITHYAFDLELDHFDFFAAAVHGPKRSVRFRLLDGPGGTLLPEPKNASDVSEPEDDPIQVEYRSRLIEAGRNSQALVLCVDGTDESQTRTFFNEISELIPAMRPAGSRFLKFESIVIVLTKADGYFSQNGDGASAAALSADPWRRAIEFLGDAGMKTLLECTQVDVTSLACGWVSAYGFCQDGTPNFDQQSNRMRTSGRHWSEQEVIRAWKPFQILDPFIYLAAGELGGLRLLDRRKSKH